MEEIAIMGFVSKTGDTGNNDQEDFWRIKVNQWQQTGKTQAEFCKEEGLNANTFSRWKRLLPKRDLQARRSARTRQRSVAANTSRVGTAEAGPAFIRLELSDPGEESTAATKRVPLPEQAAAPVSVAAELIDLGNGRRVRIFNGADQPTVAALLSALSVL